MRDINDKINKLYDEYPILKYIDEDNNGIIKRNVIFKDLTDGEYLRTLDSTCTGFLFVLSGTIKIQRVTSGGEETNLYNIERGGLCHEALSCFLNYEPLNIEAKAIQVSSIALIPSDILIKYVMNDTRFLKLIYKDLYSKFSVIIDNKEQRVQYTLETRVIKYLIGKKSNIIYTTHKEIAFEIDSAREAVSRKLKKLESMGYISASRGKLEVIKDLNELI